MKAPRISGPAAGKIDRSVPAYNYELFITAFERIVAEKQKEIRRMEKMESIYSTIVSILKPLNICNEQRLTFGPDWVKLVVKLTENDRLDDFTQIVREKIGPRLFETGLHRNGEPSIGHFCNERSFRFQLKPLDKFDKEKPRSFTIEAVVPFDGCLDYFVDVKHRTYTTVEHILTPREVKFESSATTGRVPS